MPTPIDYPIEYLTFIQNARDEYPEEDETADRFFALFWIFDDWTDFSNGPYAPYQSFLIARYILEEPFTAAEHIIQLDPPTAVEYAKQVLAARFNAAETAISQNAMAAADYAMDVLQTRWNAAETVIFTNPIATANYVNRLINKKHVAAENIIKEHPNAIYKYAKGSLKGRWPQGEGTMLGFGHSALCAHYSFDCVKGRWIAAENIIQRNTTAWEKYRAVWGL